MASIIKRKYTPKGPDGKPVIGKDGKPLILECKVWTIQYRDAAGKIKRVKGYSDYGATKQKAAKLEKSLAHDEEEITDPFKAHKRRPLSEHAAEYIQSLTDGGCDEMYAYTAGKRLDSIIDGCGWRTTTDISAESFERWRQRVKSGKQQPAEKSRRRLGKGESGREISATSLNQYLDTAGAFCNWMIGKRSRKMKAIPTTPRMKANPLTDVAKIVGDEQRKRRALSDEDLAKFMAILPEHHLLIYRFAMTTGMRRDELEQLTWGGLRLNSPTPHTATEGKTQKSGRSDQMAIRPEIAAELKTMKPAGAADSDRVFSVPTMDEHRAYLAEAGIPYIDADGRQFDLHACRVQLASMLNRMGTPVAVAMAIMRHTDARLTMRVYNDATIFNAADAVNKLPLPTFQPKAETVAQ